jgi:hypothetical protein
MSASQNTKIGNDFTFQIGSPNPNPTSWANFCAVTDTGQIGESSPQIDVTTLCDDARAYRGGLADGAQISLKCNYIQGDTATRALYAAYKSRTNQNFRLKVDETTPEEYFQFAASVLGWNVTAPVGAKSEVTFTLKISGGVTWVYT